MTLRITLYYNMKKLIWNEWNKRHIKKHNVTVDEVEEAYENKKFEIDSYSDRKKLYGLTNKGRMMIVIISKENNKSLYVFSARNMSRKERREYYVQTKTDDTI